VLYLVILAQGQVQLAGEIEGLLDSHRTLVGGPSDRALLERDTSVIRSSHTPAQTTMLVKLNGRPAAGQWEEHHVGLEELVPAYLSRPAGDSSARLEPVEAAKRQ
jgi:ABC-2 type transport system ATP-binding protein